VNLKIEVKSPAVCCGAFNGISHIGAAVPNPALAVGFPGFFLEMEVLWNIRITIKF
jgi:hypothetical protein